MGYEVPCVAVSFFSELQKMASQLCASPFALQAQADRFCRVLQNPDCSIKPLHRGVIPAPFPTIKPGACWTGADPSAGFPTVHPVITPETQWPLGEENKRSGIGVISAEREIGAEGR